MKQLELMLPPVPLMLIVAFSMWLIDRFTPATLLFSHQSFLAYGLLMIGLLFIFPAAISFFKAKTTVDPRAPHKSNVLVISGLYKISRNPMYVGMVLCLFSLGLAQGNIISVFISVGFALYLTHFQIKPEERFLTKRFGEQYQQYCANVRRWI
jgi:protein-S-isoprenylcysteine O-methyltransferase Ste14